MPNVTMNLWIGPSIQINTPTNGTKWVDRSSADKRTARLALQNPLTVEPWPTILAGWQNFAAGVDAAYEDTSPVTMQSFIQNKFNAANTDLSSNFGYTISVGEAIADWPGDKKPECMVRARHSFKIYKVQNGITLAWAETSDGVVGPMIATLEWVCPAAT